MLYYYKMLIETDLDFSLVFKGEEFVHQYIELVLESVDELDLIELRGPFLTDRTPDLKVYEFEEAVKAIKKNPDEYFSNTGGNRVVEWTPLDALQRELSKVPPGFREFVSDTAHSHADSELEVLQQVKELTARLLPAIRQYLLHWAGTMLS